MISVGRRIQETIDYMETKELLSAMTPACIALDITSQKYANKTRSNRSDYKKFVRDYMWLISYMGFPGLMTNAIRVSFSHPEVKPDESGHIGIEDVIYHAIRCSLMHEDEKSSKIVWSNDVLLGSDPEGNLVLNQSLIWGLVGAVVFCPVNSNEVIPKNYWISIDGIRTPIYNSWGRIDIPQRIIKLKTGINISGFTSK